MSSRIQIGNPQDETSHFPIFSFEWVHDLRKKCCGSLGTLRRGMGIFTIEEMGITGEKEVLKTLSNQCELRPVTVKYFADQNFPRELLRLVPKQLALEKLVFPHEQMENMLSIVMHDPFDSDTLKCLADRTELKISPNLATKKEILAVVNRHYIAVQVAPGAPSGSMRQNNRSSENDYYYVYYKCPECNTNRHLDIRTGIHNAKCSLCNTYPFKKRFLLLKPKVLHYYAVCKYCDKKNRIPYNKNIRDCKCVRCRNLIYHSKNAECPNCGETKYSNVKEDSTMIYAICTDCLKLFYISL